MSYKCISMVEAQAFIDNKATLVDIRDANSFSQASIPDAINVDNENVAEFIANADKTKPLIVYCYHGNSSKGAADYFCHQGFGEVFSLDGGFDVWRLNNER